MDYLEEERLRIVTETVREVMGREVCGSYRFGMPGRELPVVCAMAPGHAGIHRFASWSWPDA